MHRSLSITSTGTSSGKTFVTRGLAAAYRGAGHRVAALKPLETGCVPDPLDALALERAAGTTGFARDAGFYRVEPPLAPHAATLTGCPPPVLESLVARIRMIAADHAPVLVEGAGGLLVPLDRTHDFADLARALGYPLLIVAPNRLGVLSHVLALHEAALRRELSVAAVVLTEIDLAPDPSQHTNGRILQERLPTPILAFPHCRDDDNALAAAISGSGLLDALAL